MAPSSHSNLDESLHLESNSQRHDSHKEYACDATTFLTGTFAAIGKKENEQKRAITSEPSENPVLQAVQKAGAIVRETFN